MLNEQQIIQKLSEFCNEHEISEMVVVFETPFAKTLLAHISNPADFPSDLYTNLHKGLSEVLELRPDFICSACKYAGRTEEAILVNVPELTPPLPTCPICSTELKFLNYGQ